MKGNGAPPRAQMERINERRNIEQGEHFSAFSNAATRRAQLVLISHAAVPCFLPHRIISGKRRQPKASCRGFFAALTPLRFLPPLAPPSLSSSHLRLCSAARRVRVSVGGSTRRGQTTVAAYKDHLARQPGRAPTPQAQPSSDLPGSGGNDSAQLGVRRRRALLVLDYFQYLQI